MTAACEGPAFVLWVVLAPQFDLRWKATPLGYFLRLSSFALHLGGLGLPREKAGNTISLISACGWVFNVTVGCEGPVYTLWFVLASQFDLRRKATPHVFLFAPK